MKPSPLQVNRLIFTKVNIEPTFSPFEENSHSIDALNFDFDKVVFNVAIETGIAEGQDENPLDYYVELKYSILNEAGKICPYKVDMAAAGIMKVSEKIPVAKRDNIVTVNGASILMGAIREMVSTITSRSALGLLMLPTVNFADHAIENSNSKDELKESDKPQKTKKLVSN
jgi:preprotein translocase subunit SecB